MNCHILPVRVVDLEAVVGQRRLGGELHSAVLADLADRLLVVHRRNVVLEPVRRRERLAALIAIDPALHKPPLSQVHSLKRKSVDDVKYVLHQPRGSSLTLCPLSPCLEASII